MNSKTTKRALISSVLAMLLCFTMLLSTTFAWFTDSVTSANNKIQSGTLKLDLSVLENGVWTSIKTSQKALFDYDKWEPGYTEFKILKIENKGTLALKWYATFSSETALSDLANVIDVYVLPSATEIGVPADRNLTGYTKVGTLAEFVNTIETTTNGVLYADGTAGDEAYLGIAIKMREEAGNEYQGLDLGGAFDITILATQLNSESDSFDKDYDVDAPVIEVTPATAQAVLDEAQDAVVIKLLPGNYGTLTLDEGTNHELSTTSNSMLSEDIKNNMYTRKFTDIVIIGTDGAVVDGINVISQRVWESNDTSETGPAHYTRIFADNITIENVDFVGTGIQLYLYEGSSTCRETNLGNVKALNVIDCGFTGEYGIRIINNTTVNGVTTYCKPVDLYVDGCVFNEIGADVADPANQGRTALYVQHSGDMTITNSTFSAIQYDSIQVAHKASGKTTITNNTFANVDGYKDYIARAMNLNGVVGNATIEGNYFKQSNSTKSNKYIKTGATVNVGVNTWEYAPEDADFKNVVIDITEQIIENNGPALPAVGVSAENCTWEEIKAIADAGRAEDYFEIGDTKTLTLTDGTEVPMTIVAFNIDEKTDGTAASITWIATAPIANHAMNNPASVAGGWGASQLRAWLQSDVYDTLPADLKGAIATVNKVSIVGTASSDVATTQDTLWIPSIGEVNSKDVTKEKNCATYYEYFDANGIYTSLWWMRSVENTSAEFPKFYTGQKNAYLGNFFIGSTAETENAVIIGFCI